MIHPEKIKEEIIKNNCGDMAFPIALDKHSEQIVVKGLTKREWFAGMAMQGMLANSDGINRCWKHVRENNPNLLPEECTPLVVAHLGEKARELADGLIKELDGTKGNDTR